MHTVSANEALGGIGVDARGIVNRSSASASMRIRAIEIGGTISYGNRVVSDYALTFVERSIVEWLRLQLDVPRRKDERESRQCSCIQGCYRCQWDGPSNRASTRVVSAKSFFFMIVLILLKLD